MPECFAFERNAACTSPFNPTTPYQLPTLEVPYTIMCVVAPTNPAFSEPLPEASYSSLRFVPIRLTNIAIGERDSSAVDAATSVLWDIRINLPMCNWPGTEQCSDFQLFKQETEIWFDLKSVIDKLLHVKYLLSFLSNLEVSG